MKWAKSFLTPSIFIALLFLILASPSARADWNVEDEQGLSKLEKTWSKGRIDYRDALKKKARFLEDEINRIENLLVIEDNKAERRKLVEQLQDFTVALEEVRDTLDVLNVGDVVQISNTKNKIMRFLTRR